MAARRSTTSYAILGLLSVRPWTTYELTQQVRRSLNWFWPRAERKLYDEPKRMVDQGLATAATEYTGRRRRTVYTITDEGRDELARWLGEPPTSRLNEFAGMVKLFFADAGTLDQVNGTLDAMEAECVERLDSLGVLAAGPKAFPEREHISALTLPLQLEQERAVLTWVRWAREQVVTWESTTDPGRWDYQQVLAELVDDASRASGRD